MMRFQYTGTNKALNPEKRRFKMKMKIFGGQSETIYFHFETENAFSFCGTKVESENENMFD